MKIWIPKICETQLFLAEVSMQQAFPFLEHPGHRVALAGGGGKTSWMYRLAAYSASLGRRTVVMTTTHIQKPVNLPVCDHFADVRAKWDLHIPALIGIEAAKQKTEDIQKLTAPNQELYHQILTEAEDIYIEADGAKRMPIKLPAMHEPVITPECDIVIGVAGLQAMGKSFREACFRAEGTEFASEIITPGNLSEILLSEQGTRKNVGEREYYVILNQCDDEVLRLQALETAQKLYHLGHKKIVVSYFDEAERGEMQ